MRLGIDAKVDYAFKRLFGSLGHEELLIDLLNAVLAATLEEPIASVEILNPFTDKTSIDDKLSILDVKARDGSGRLFNVEMQMRVNSSHAARALFYWAGVYREQLGEGEDYIDLRPTIAIHFVNELLFPEIADYHLDFQLRSRCHSQIIFCPHIQFHLIELPKLNVTMKVIGDSLDRWCYVLRQGEELNTDDLPANLATPAIQKALEVLAMLAQTPQERALYEARLDAKRERSTDLMLSRREGRQEGLAEGLEKGLEKGLERGKREGLLDAIELGLESKFGLTDQALLERVKTFSDLSKLRTMFRQLNAAASLDELRQLWS